MKACIYIVVLLFFTFLAAPTIVSILHEDDKAGITAMCSLEEEIQKEIKEVKAAPQIVLDVAFITFETKSAFILSKNPHGHKNVFGDIFLPPPELI
jgi:hypothetical protein